MACEQVLTFRGPIRVPIWHIEALCQDLKSWSPLARAIINLTLPQCI